MSGLNTIEARRMNAIYIAAFDAATHVAIEEAIK